VVGGTFLPLKIIFQKKKTEKKESHFNKGGQAEKPKGNGISPEGWQGTQQTRRSHHICPAIMP